MNCPICNAVVPTATEQTYRDAVLCAVTYIVLHPYEMNALLGRCQGSTTVVDSTPVENP